MSITIQLKDGYCWLSDEIFLVLVSFQDRRCHQKPKSTHRCFWEGDFECTFDVMRIVRDNILEDSPKAIFLRRVKLNDHDHKKNLTQLIPLSSTRVLSLSGGPNYASGYQVTNSLRFQLTCKIS